MNNELQASFFVRICDILGAPPVGQQAAQKGKKGEAPPVEEKDLTERRTIKLELFRENELVAFAFGQNKVILSLIAQFINFLIRLFYQMLDYMELIKRNQEIIIFKPVLIFVNGQKARKKMNKQQTYTGS